ncbi:hypothetical protein Tsp_09616 [Trichinella spiralis]|uniref:hypothetical protein n=1 Tax=Trichinella spiralis TaxID=6334 RepID=UPI0001EFEE5E|nr:hypothetical protein Tsp_09616 [Trichinella spiralis]
MNIHMRIQERLDKRVCSSVLLIESAFMMTAQAFVEGFHCPTAPSVPVVVASQRIYSRFALSAGSSSFFPSSSTLLLCKSYTQMRPTRTKRKARKARKYLPSTSQFNATIKLEL